MSRPTPWQLVGFVGRSLRASFRGEPLTHLLTLTTVCVSLTLAGAVGLAQRNLVSWAEHWAADLAVAIYFRPELDDAQRQAFDRRLRDEAHLEDVVWTAPAASATELARSLGLEGAEALRTFAPWVAEGRKGEQTRVNTLDDLSADPLVLHIDYGTVVAERLRAVARSVRSIGAALVTLLRLGAFLVVSNTIGLALNARRDEVEIMSLVGTPMTWIYTAFLTEGLLLGLGGATVAIGALELLVAATGPALAATLSVPAVHGPSATGIILLLGAGSLIGVIGSALATRRFLR